jgi:hypothetical protein
MPGRPLRILACTITAAAVFAFAGQAQAAGSRNFFGVATPSYPSGTQFQRVARGGAANVRLQLYWGAVEPTAGTRDWQLFDSIVGDAARAGVTLLPALFGTPRWASAQAASYDGNSPPIYNRESRAAWSDFLSAAAQRYGSTGSFWASHPELPRTPIRYWEVWNEVNLPAFWGGRPSPRGYADLLRLTGNALRAGDPSAKVVLAGLLPYKSIVAGSIAGPQFLRRLYRVKGIRKLFDVAAVHPYAVHPPEVLSLIRDMRRVLNSHHSRKTPIWVTEFGWTTGGSDFSASPFRSTLTQQAHRVRKTYRLMRRDAKHLRLKRAFYYSLEDTANTTSWLDRMGLFGLDGQPKPAWYAYAWVAGGQP